MSGVTLDTGAIIALERGKQRATTLVRAAMRRGREVCVPMPVMAEWWRGSPEHVRLRRSFEVVPLEEETARSAGVALVLVGSGPSAVDAMVMATAARRGDIVLSSDVEDLERLREVFRSVRVLRI